VLPTVADASFVMVCPIMTADTIDHSGMERIVRSSPRCPMHPLHAPSTPVAVRSVIRHPADLSQEDHTLLVSTILETLTTRLRRVHFRSSLGCSPARVCSRTFTPTLTTTAFYRSSLEWFEICS